MAASGSLTEVLRQINLPSTLEDRIHVTKNGLNAKKSFILYLPTVVLRRQHNPALALACRLANHYQLPLLILCVVLDDSHLPITSDLKPTVATARRLTFWLQALQKASIEWQELGAHVFTRVHGPQARTPHHLTLARQATIVVTDEPFVYPYRQYVESIERAVSSACVRVDGSTTVPPIRLLTRQSKGTFMGVPPKAWMWQKKTDPKRKDQVDGAVQDGHLDSPELDIKDDHSLQQYLPKEWNDANVPAPGKRPWTFSELREIVPEEWSLTWPGIDASVPPCLQTHGADGWPRWKRFQQAGLAQYAKRRNNIQEPHAVSRLSCYLNHGTISIFQIVYELWQDSRNTQKFEDEIIKWREMSYAHAFSTPDYFAPSAVPRWARHSLEQAHSSPYTLDQLAESQTDDAKWNAMQDYLRETGELHNNARMTWGKTVVHWQKGLDLSEMLRHMAYINDRYALDGLSPPSYAGLLWCLGWCDKPRSGGDISEKPSWQYRVGPDGFQEAQRRLLQSHSSIVTFLQPQPPPQKKRKKDESSADKASTTKLGSKTLLSYFSPAKHKRSIG